MTTSRCHRNECRSPPARKRIMKAGFGEITGKTAVALADLTLRSSTVRCLLLRPEYFMSRGTDCRHRATLVFIAANDFYLSKIIS